MAISAAYCTNVFAGSRLSDVAAALTNQMTHVRTLVQPLSPLPLGLWFSQSAAAELKSERAIGEFKQLLNDRQLTVTTLNGFPFGDFHQPVVKHAVYEPSWAEPTRLAYTIQLVDVLIELLGDGEDGTISTLPLGWPGPVAKAEFFQTCAKNLIECAAFARKRAEQTGKRIRICLEPEPGCWLGTSRELIAFFESYLQSQNEKLTADFLGVCHDICHAVVMGESQAESIGEYEQAGVAIGKVQVSSALIAHFPRQANGTTNQITKRLGEFAEPKYLHQTVADGSFFEDLPLALQSKEGRGEWRIHFHMPIFAMDLDQGLTTSQPAIRECVELLAATPKINWEIETYAWGVLPESLRPTSLAAGIANELLWFQSLMQPDVQDTDPAN